MVDYLGKKTVTQNAQIHDRVGCDGCQTTPINGIRYKCSVCPNFDFCEKCEAEQVHAHPFLKIRKPEQAPAFISCTYQQQQMAQSNASSTYSHSGHSVSRRCNKKPQDRKVNHQARFVKESFGDRFPVFSGASFTKTWTFRNGGEAEWPEDTLFIRTNGDDFKDLPQSIKGPIMPNEEIDVTVTMTAPQVPGNYIAFFRFVHGDNNRFGQKVWCDILVQPSPATSFILQTASFKQNEPAEERSSLLSESLVEEAQPQPIHQIDFKFEMVNAEENPSIFTTANPFSAAKQSPVATQDIFSMIADNKPSNDLAMSQFEEKEVIEEEEKQPEIVVLEEVDVSAEKQEPEESSLMNSEPSAEDLDKIRYLEKVSLLQDAKLIENLQYIYDMGYTNFEVNIALLRRNNNDLIIAINNLCNGLVSESMFNQE